MNAYEYLKEIGKLLIGIKGIKSLKIGLEPNISPSDYPIIRIVPNEIRLSDDFDLWASDISFSVYFGAQLHEKIGLEKIYEQLYSLEYEIKERLHNAQFELNADKTRGGGICRFIATKDDGDTLKNFKILVSEFELKGGR